MAHNEQEKKKPQGGGPEAHPTNKGPSKTGGDREGRTPGQGGNKVSQGTGSDSGNKGQQ